MKKMSKMLAVIAFALVATVSLNAKDDTFDICYDNVQITVCDLAPNADFTALNACYQIKVSPDAVKPCSSLVLTPVIKNGNDKKLAEVIVVNGTGKIGSLRWLEKQIYDVCDPNSVRFFTLKEGETLTINSCNAFPYESWMEDGAKFYVTSQEVVYDPNNCIKAFPGEEYVCEVPYLKGPYFIAPQFVDMTSNADFRAERIVRTKLFYPVNITKQVDSYLENADGLALLSTLDQGNFEVSSIEIDGWASPEATVPYNENLSENRAKTVKKIIADKYGFDEKVYTVEGKGEYWDSVINFVSSTDNSVVSASRSALQDAINSNSDLDKREAAMKKVDGGKPYKVIFDETYPRSRFAECVVRYKVIEFNYDDAYIIFKNDPESLSADDYVAMMNVKVEDDVYSKAIELYPDDQRFNALAAQQAIDEKNYDKAIKYLNKSGDSQPVMNNLGCCYVIKGEYEKAKDYFKKAWDLRTARYNYSELRQALLNQKYFVE